jgi:hypothetical protein
MGVAFEMVRVALGLADQGYVTNEIIAKHIIKLLKLASAILTFCANWH